MKVITIYVFLDCSSASSRYKEASTPVEMTSIFSARLVTFVYDTDLDQSCNVKSGFTERRNKATHDATNYILPATTAKQKLQ
jgi:hypothetical protein